MAKLMEITMYSAQCVFDAAGRCTRCGYQCSGQVSGPMQCSASGKTRIGFMFWCPGCKAVHPFYTAEHRSAYGMKPNPVWSFNGNLEKPTFGPSLQVGRPGDKDCCHLHLIDGVIQYANDGGCAHALKGQHVPLGEFKWYEEEG